MESSEFKNAGDQKVEEYVARIQAGESKDVILQGLSESFVSGIEERLSTPSAPPSEFDYMSIPPQYEGMSSEAVEMIWTIPEYIEPEVTKKQKEWKERALASLRARESHASEAGKRIKELRDAMLRRGQSEVAEPDINPEKTNTISEGSSLSIEERRSLDSWPASYELAKIAKNEGIDLTKLSREEYVEYAIRNSLPIDDDQLRMSVQERVAISPEEVLKIAKERRAQIRPEIEKEFARFSYEIRQIAQQENRVLEQGVRVREGTAASGSWLFFGINEGIREDVKAPYKSYVSLKDLNTLTPKKFMMFMTTLRDAGYSGDIKIFQDLTEQGVRLNDQVVMHGNSKEDATLALKIAEQFFGSDLDQKGTGKDEFIDGKGLSYSQVLAEKIKKAVKG